MAVKKYIDAPKRHYIDVTPYIVLPNQISYRSIPKASLKAVTEYNLNYPNQLQNYRV